jgi:integrase
VDWERGTYTPGVTKGKEADPVPVPDWLFDYLRPVGLANGLIVLNTRGRPFSRGFTRIPMLAANNACGITGLTAHRLRGSFATLMSEQGVPVQTIQRVMRHKDTRTTMFYLETNLDLVVDAQARVAEKTGLIFNQMPKHSGEKMANG